MQRASTLRAWFVAPRTFGRLPRAQVLVPLVDGRPAGTLPQLVGALVQHVVCVRASETILQADQTVGAWAAEHVTAFDRSAGHIENTMYGQNAMSLSIAATLRHLLDPHIWPTAELVAD